MSYSFMLDKPLRKLLNRYLNIPTIKYDLEIAKIGTEKSLIVDLGCGNGKLLRSLKLKFPIHDYIGVDTALESDEIIDGVHLISEDLFTFANSERIRNARIIILNDVIEHLNYPDIIRLFTLFGEKLNNGTVLFFQFPNCASPFGLRNQTGDLTHLSFLSASKFKQIVSKSTFRCHIEIFGVEEVTNCMHPIIDYIIGFFYYKFVCKILSCLLCHSIGWNKFFWEPNLMAKITCISQPKNTVI